MIYRIASLVLLFSLCGLYTASGEELPLLSEKQFQAPPDEARPWVYWFWMDGNITEEGITADLEAMQRVGVGGVLIMEISVSQPVGPVVFMSERWREFFKHAVQEAARLGMEITMNAGPGWNGSGGPWITPEKSMQLVTISDTKLSGPKKVSVSLPQPKTTLDFYRDITVLAFPTPASAKARFPEYNPISATLYRQETPASEVGEKDVVPLESIREIKKNMDADGLLTWDVPEGDWTVLRIGHTAKGVECSPAPVNGHGLECDKLSKEGIEAAYTGMISKLAGDNRSNLGKTFVRTHIDSWENGTQNWTARMREEFQKRRGYDIVPFLPVFAGYFVDSHETIDRFLWDLRRTISEMIYDNYFTRLMELAHADGLGLSTEGYWAPSDQIPFAGLTDEPMGEFWWVGAALETCRGMASAGHVYGKNIIGAEAFTAADDERWLGHPGQMKALGDAAFCEGINRFVFHRYAMQPWLDRWPGNTMGPYGVHYERTQTWWEPSKDWNLYLTRCQTMLRQGKFVADICYLEWEDSPQGFTEHLRLGYGWDQAGAHAVQTLMTVEDGLLALPGGMKYKILVLPQTDRMTPELIRKVEKLIQEGATVIGSKPQRAWGMNRFKDIDAEVREVADRIWGQVDTPVGERPYGKGRIVWGRTPENVLGAEGLPPDFSSDARLQYIHRRTADSDIYFVVNPTEKAIPATVQFRVRGRVPQFWHPVTGKVETAAMYSEVDGKTVVSMTFEPNESVFVVFKDDTDLPKNRILSVFRNGHRVASGGLPLFRFLVKRADYGIPGDASRSVDVKDLVQQKLDAGEREIKVIEMSLKKDPAPGISKILEIDYAFDWEPDKIFKLQAGDMESILMNQEAVAIDVKSAKYGLLDKPDQTIDMTKKLSTMLERGENCIPVVLFAREKDPAIGETKHIEILYTQEGEEKKIKLRDGETVIFQTSLQRSVVAKPLLMEKTGATLEIFEPGAYDIVFEGEEKVSVDVQELKSTTIEGDWHVVFPVGIPADGKNNKTFKEHTFSKLIPWNKHEDDFVRYFSGTAMYRKTFSMPKGWKRENERLYLDLGTVDVMAELNLNGKDLGVLWTPLKRIDVTDLLLEGENRLKIKVTNLWPNKMIGDDRLPEDTERFEDGRPKEWPKWLLEGKSSPTGRETFTAWKLWDKDKTLLPSGLSGPVRLVPTKLISRKP